MKRHCLILLALALWAELCSASAAPLKWSCNWPEAKSQTFSLYHGESATFEPVFVVNGKAATNLTIEAVYYQTNGMADAWWQLPGATFAPSNDCGAASYRFFVRAADAAGVNYRANGVLRMLDSPGFTPGEVALPIRRLDFSTVEVANAPYYTKDETDAKIVELAPTPDLSDYATTQSLMAEVSSASQSATNYTDGVATTLRGEIAAAQPADYATVSNKAMTALQSYTETDPTIYSWAKAASKPTYSLNEVAPSTENWLGVPGTTAGGKSIKVLAKTVNGVIEGGMTVTGSSNNDNNTTKYRYGGVTATRNGTATDYLFDTSSQSGIVRRVELDDKVDASVVTTLANKVDAIETWAIGDETALVIHDAGQTNATLTVTYTNDVMYSSAVAESNTLAKAMAQTDSAIVTALEAVGTALDAKAPKAWGTLTSGGAPAPDDTLVVEKKKVTITGGGNYARVESATGAYFVMAVELGSNWTLESLASEQNPTNSTAITLYDADENPVYQVVSTASRVVDAIAGADMLAPSVSVVSGNDVVTINFPVVANEPPTLYYAPTLSDDFAEATAANWPGVVASRDWSGTSGLYTVTITMVGQPGSGFFCAKYEKPGSTCVKYTQPVALRTIVIDDITYTISVETINGKKLMVLTEVN